MEQTDERAIASLTVVDMATGLPLAMQVPRKGPWAFAIYAVVEWIRKPNYERITLLDDGEFALQSLMRSIAGNITFAVLEVRSTAPGSH